LAIVPPLVNPTPASAGIPRSSASHPPATSSATAAAGDRTNRPAFWSQALVSQSAHDEPEVARTGAPDETRIDRAGKPLENGLRRLAGLGQRPTESRPHGVRLDRDRDRALVDVGEIGGGQPGGLAEQRVVGHGDLTVTDSAR
jgi:hypothetical protein